MIPNFKAHIAEAAAQRSSDLALSMKGLKSKESKVRKGSIRDLPEYFGDLNVNEASFLMEALNERLEGKVQEREESLRVEIVKKMARIARASPNYDAFICLYRRVLDYSEALIVRVHAATGMAGVFQYAQTSKKSEFLNLGKQQTADLNAAIADIYRYQKEPGCTVADCLGLDSLQRVINSLKPCPPA